MAVVVAAGAARAAEERLDPPDGRERQDRETLPLPSLELTHGAAFVWPALDARAYAEADAAPFREAVARWRSGAPPEATLPAPRSPAALYLAADLALLAARAGRGDLWSAALAYERALRAAPDFPDAARGLFLLGQTYLALGFAPEAGAAFRRLEHRFPDGPLALDGQLGQAAALRLHGRPGEARRLLDGVLARARGEVLCRARLEEALEERAAGRPATAADALRDVGEGCPQALASPDGRRATADAIEGRRAETLGRWIAALGARGDAAGVAIVFAAHATEFEALAAPEDRLAVARALGALGLHAPAARLLERAPDPVLAVTCAEEALAAGDAERAEAALGRLAGAALPAALASRAHGAAARVALSAHHLERAAAEAAEVDDVALRAEVAAALVRTPGGGAPASALLRPALAAPSAPVRVLLVAAAAAAADRAWEVAAEAYGRALAAAPAGPERLEAAAGLARATRARGEIDRVEEARRVALAAREAFGGAPRAH